jgi:hypothetical protein
MKIMYEFEARIGENESKQSINCSGTGGKQPKIIRSSKIS